MRGGGSGNSEREWPHVMCVFSGLWWEGDEGGEFE